MRYENHYPFLRYGDFEKNGYNDLLLTVKKDGD